MPETPPEPMALLYAAAEHVRNGVPEVEVEWAWDPGGEGDSRCTVVLRHLDRNTSLRQSADAEAGRTPYQVVDRDSHHLGTVQVPNTPEGLEP